MGGSTIDLMPGGNQNPVSGTSIGCTGGPAAGTPLGTPDQYYDPCQFVYPAANCITLSNQQLNTANCAAGLPLLAGTFVGNVGRNHMTAPGLANVDFTLMKETRLSRLHEGASLEFRAEFFNLFNRANFDQPSASLFDRSGARTAGAGAISSTISNAPARQIQFAVRLAF
jgi:hypothetical protein